MWWERSSFFLYLCSTTFVRTKDPGLHFFPLKASQLNSPFTREAQHISSSTDVGLQGYGLLPSFFFFFLPLFSPFLAVIPKREGKHPVIWIHSSEELYKILTILPGAKLELDAVRINWWSFAKRVEKTSFAKSKSYKPPAGVVRGRLVGIVAAYVWCQEHHWFAFLLYEFYKAEMLFCVEVIPKVSVAINHKWNLSADEKP